MGTSRNITTEDFIKFINSYNDNPDQYDTKIFDLIKEEVVKLLFEIPIGDEITIKEITDYFSAEYKINNYFDNVLSKQYAEIEKEIKMGTTERLLLTRYFGSAKVTKQSKLFNFTDNLKNFIYDLLQIICKMHDKFTFVRIKQKILVIE